MDISNQILIRINGCVIMWWLNKQSQDISSWIGRGGSIYRPLKIIKIKYHVITFVEIFPDFYSQEFRGIYARQKNLYASGINMKKFILIYRYDMRENKQEVMLTSYRTLIHSYVIFLLYFYFRFRKIIRILKITR